MELNKAEVLPQVEDAFRRYETALVTNDVSTLDALFWNNELTIRYGGGENLYGYSEIAAFRAARPSVGLNRQLERTLITSFGDHVATANTLFRRDSAPGKIGRQSQIWVKFPEGWRVVSAHVSVIAET